MNINILKICSVFALSFLFWYFVSYWSGSEEPWDSGSYLTLWYPLSILLAAFGGYLLGRHGWLSGVAVTFGQIPIVAINNGAGSLLAAGLLYLIVMAVPLVIISAFIGRYAARH